MISISYKLPLVWSWLTPKNDPKNVFTMGVLRYALRQAEVPKKCFFRFLQASHDEISKFSISQELYIKLNWLTFQNDRKTRDLSKQFWCPVDGTKNSIFIKFYFKAYLRWTYIQNTLAYYISSILNYSFVLQMQKDPLNPHQGFAMNPLWSFTAYWDPHLHFTTFENSIFVQKRTLVKLLG